MLLILIICFSCCSNLYSLDLHNVDTRNITIMSFMVAGCYNLYYLHLCNFDIRNVVQLVICLLIVLIYIICIYIILILGM